MTGQAEPPATISGTVEVAGDLVAGNKVIFTSPAVLPVPRQLPPDVGDFTGRTDDLDVLDGLLDPGNSGIPVLAIVGMAGLGKSALAVHWGHRVSAAFGDGQLFVDLGAGRVTGSDPRSVLGELLRTLGIASPLVPATLAGREALFRSLVAGKKMLLILDDAVDEAQVRPLLPGTAGCTVVVTSRRPLTALPGVRHLDLAALTDDQAVELLAKTAGDQRIAAEPDAAVSIARNCGYLPLAIRIAGARLASRPHWSLARLADRLDREAGRLDELHVGDLGVRASFTASYEGLPVTDRRGFQLLGLIDSATFPEWVLEPLLDISVEEAEATLDRLCQAHLVEVGSRRPGGEVRYQVHDLLRLFAGERLAAEYPPHLHRAALERLAATYLRLADRADEGLRPGGLRHDGRASAARCSPAPFVAAGAQRHSVDWFETERPFLLTLVERTHAHGLWDLCWQLADAMSVYFEYQWRWEDSLRTHTLALDAARASGNRLGQAALLRNRGEARRDSGDLEAATRDFMESHALFVGLGDRVGVADTLANLGTLQRLCGRLSEAEATLTRSLELFRTLRILRGQAWSLRELGAIHRFRGHRAKAIQAMTEALAIFDRTGEQRGQACALRTLGDIYVDEYAARRDERPEGMEDIAAQARAYLGRSLPLFAELADRRHEAWVYRALAELGYLQGDLEQSEADLATALGLVEPRPDQRVLGHIYGTLAAVRHRQGHTTEAVELGHRSSAILHEVGDLVGRIWALTRLACIARDSDHAVSHTAQAQAEALSQEFSIELTGQL